MPNFGVWESLTCFIVIAFTVLPCLVPGFVAQRRGRRFSLWSGISFLSSLGVLGAFLVAYAVLWFAFASDAEGASMEETLCCCPPSPCLAPFTAPLMVTILLLAMPAKRPGTETRASAEQAHHVDGAVGPTGDSSSMGDVSLGGDRAPTEVRRPSAEIPPTALHEAAADGDLDALRDLLASGCDPNAPDDKEGWTPLHWAVKNGHVEAARLLLDEGARVGAQYLQRYTPLHLAVADNRVDAVRLLLARGADPNQRDFAGRAPLRVASSCGSYQVAELLLDRGAIVDLRADDGTTPLHEAALRDQTDLVTLLLQRGALVNAQSGSGATALHIACLNGNVELVQILLGAGADISIIDSNGETALEWSRSDEVRELLHKPRP
jgi:ankyrin repeat protein